MRKYLFIIMCAFLSLWAGKVSAQRYLPGQTGLELRLGGVDDFGRNVRHLRAVPEPLQPQPLALGIRGGLCEEALRL